jgi:thioredoxin 2
VSRTSADPSPGPPERSTRPQLLFFSSHRSGRCRRVDGFLALILQRRRNHQTFKVIRVTVEESPALSAAFGITQVPTLLVLADSDVKARLEAPDSRAEIQDALSPWLR